MEAEILLNRSNSEYCEITNHCITVAYGHEKGPLNILVSVTLQ